MTATNGSYADIVERHYFGFWNILGSRAELPKSAGLPLDFRVVEIRLASDAERWVYATCGMARKGEKNPIELYLISPKKSSALVEFLCAVADYNFTAHRLGLGHTVNFGKPWLEDSLCDYGLVSLPYVDGPELEALRLPEGKSIRIIWLLPITKAEIEFKKLNGIEGLERAFDEAQIDYTDIHRASVY